MANVLGGAQVDISNRQAQSVNNSPAFKQSNSPGNPERMVN